MVYYAYARVTRSRAPVIIYLENEFQPGVVRSRSFLLFIVTLSYSITEPQTENTRISSGLSEMRGIRLPVGQNTFTRTFRFKKNRQSVIS